MSYLIRAVDPERDAQRLVDIYNPYIEKTTITYEYDSLTREQFLERINSVIKDYPYIVIEDDGEIIGYAYASCFNERSAYSWDADLAIYLDMNCRGKGAGSLLLRNCLKYSKNADLSMRIRLSIFRIRAVRHFTKSSDLPRREAMSTAPTNLISGLIWVFIPSVSQMRISRKKSTETGKNTSDMLDYFYGWYYNHQVVI